MLRAFHYAVIILSIALIASFQNPSASLSATTSSMVERAKPLVIAQLTESLSVTGVSEAQQQLAARGDGVGVLVIDDWNSIIPGVPHGESVVEIIRKTAPGADVWTCKLDFSIALISDFQGCLEEVESRELPVQIINMSFSMGDKFYSSPCGTDLTEFGREIHRLAQKGIIFVGSAGNQGVKTGLRFPACHDDVISVGATYDYDGDELSFEGDDFSCSDVARLDQITCYSNMAKYLDLLAPGTTVSTSVNPRFGGTSASAPIVSGIIALLLSKSPQLSRPEILRILKTTGKPVYDNNTRKSFARVDAFAAISSISPSAVTRSNQSSLASAAHDLKGFDGNERGRIEDDEFFEAVDLWIREKIDDDLFFSVIDAWTSQAAVQALQPASPMAVRFLVQREAGSLLFSAGSDAHLTRVVIYDGSGRRLFSGRSQGAELRWNMLSGSGKEVAIGVYYYLIESEVNGHILKQMGKFAVVR